MKMWKKQQKKNMMAFELRPSIRSKNHQVAAVILFNDWTLHHTDNDKNRKLIRSSEQTAYEKYDEESIEAMNGHQVKCIMLNNRKTTNRNVTYKNRRSGMDRENLAKQWQKAATRQHCIKWIVMEYNIETYDTFTIHHTQISKYIHLMKCEKCVYVLPNHHISSEKRLMEYLFLTPYYFFFILLRAIFGCKRVCANIKWTWSIE